eukprot:TRINITY_DN11614_c0_g1_i2.p1 TRINITY_DN11614_c0_g1~~TRINITY_DN11614_c0_g1_i2.p1  ORF type:complete len:287 (+),score=63.36 TRINITY_DN11614_c0_g1_i2:41-901(+)
MSEKEVEEKPKPKPKPKQKQKRDEKEAENAKLGDSDIDEEEQERIKQRKYAALVVEATKPIEQVVVTDPSQRMAKWDRMKKKMHEAAGITMPDDENEPALHKNEPVYVLAKADHPFKEDTKVLLIEKSRGQGTVIVPEVACKPILGRVKIVTAGQQYSNWSSMEEKMSIKVTPDFKAKIGQTGFILAKEVHPKDAEITVLAVEIPEGGVILVKSQAIQQIPIDIVEVIDPQSRYYPWPQMASILKVDDDTPSPVPFPHQIGIATAEAPHPTEKGTTVVAVNLLSSM